MPAPVELRWQLRAEAPLRAAWAVLSDTDRFNRAAGLGFSFEEVPQPDGGVKRFGRVSQFGVAVRWEELPFQFQAPHGFRSERRFIGSPLLRLVTTLELAADGPGATKVEYVVRLWPRVGLFRPLVALMARFDVFPKLDRTLKAAISAAEGDRSALASDAPPLSEEARRLLYDRTDKVEPPELREALRTSIAQAPLREQDRLSALREADRLGLDPEVAIAGFLQAVRAGAIELRWELLCPSCLGPKLRLASLAEIPGEVHCPSCNIQYDGSFPDSVAVTFRPAADIRAFEAPVDCLIGPFRTPHVLASAALMPGAEVSWSVELPEGGYRLETGPLSQSAAIEVREGIRWDAITADIDDRGIRPGLLRVRPGTVRLALRNRRDGLVHVSLQKRWRPPYTLTAGRLVESLAARDLLTPEALVPGVEVRVARGVVVAVRAIGRRDGAVGADASETLSGFLLDVDPLDTLARVLKRGAVALHTGNDSAVACYDDLDAAMAAAERVDGDVDLGAGIAIGPVVRLESATGVTPAGTTVDAALAVMRKVGGARVGVDRAAGGEVVEWIAEHHGASLMPASDHSLLRFASSKAKAQERAERMADAPAPESLGPYRLGQLLGKGGMGAVFDAVSPDGDHLVVKVLLPELATDPEAAQRFYNEARITAALEHPNIVAVHDWGTCPDGRLYIAMEKLQGHELHDELDEGPLDESRARQVGTAVLNGLDVAHSAGIVHRDIKPSNVFVGDDGSVKLIDFGIAHPMDEEDELARKGMIIGTPQYMSPEQVDRKPLDGRSDLYSVGVLLYQALAGVMPFPGADPVAVALRRTVAPATPLSEATTRALAADLQEVVMRALERDRDERFPDASTMRRALAPREATPWPSTERGTAPGG